MNNPANTDSEGDGSIAMSALTAHLAGIEVVGALRKPRKGRMLNPSAIVYMDEKEEWRSKRQFNNLTPQWQEDHRFLFRPSSVIKVDIVRNSMLLRHKIYVLGRFTGRVTDLFENDTVLDLTDESGAKIAAGVKIKLALIPDAAQDVMRRVDASVLRLQDNRQVAAVSGHIDAATTAAQTGYSDANTVGTSIAPLGDALSLIVNIMDNIADAHPILKASWTVLSSVYKAMKQQMVQDGAIQALAESLRELVGVANKYRDLPAIEGTTNVIEEIGRASLQVASLVDEYTRLPFIGRTLKFQLSDDMKTRIDQCQKQCDDLAKKFDRRVAIRTNDGVIALQLNDLRDKIYKWLSPPVPSRNHNEAREKRHSTTGSWFINGVQFLEWKEKGDSFIWIYGIPGCGKTVLCSTIIEDIIHHCKANPSFAVAYFFFDGRDSQKELQQHESLIRSLIAQIFDQCPAVPEALVKLYGDGHQQPFIGSLLSTLEVILSGFQDVYIIIDALDECIQRQKVLGWIKEITSWKKQKLHLLVTSRKEIDIEECFQLLEPGHVCLEGDSINGDVQAYLDWMLQTHYGSKQWGTIQAKIKAALMEDTSMFRLVALQLEELKNCYSDFAVDDRLKSLPQNLNDVYDQILSRIDKSNHDDAHTFLQWIAFSARPLQLEEISQVVGMNKDRHYFDPRRVYRDSKSVLAVCSGLITSSEGTVKLAHLSVKEYLVSEHIQHSITSSFWINERISHELIAQTCLVYLLQFDKPDSLTPETIQNYALARYAAEYWISHVQSGGNDDSVAIQKLIMDLLWHQHTSFVTWVQLWDLDQPWRSMTLSRQSIDIASPLYYASSAGLHKTVKALLEKGAEVNAEGEKYGNALQAASYSGHESIVRLLLEKGADINAEGGGYGNALQAASYSGHESIVRLLLEKEAEVNAEGGRYGNALQAASYSGHESIVRLLLEKGAEVNAEGGRYGNALQAASYEGHEGMVRLLLEKGAEVNAQGGFYGNAVHAASYHGHEGTVKLLLEKGAQVNAQGGAYGNTLQAASYRGHEGIVRLLLEKGAEINAQGGFYGNALQAASHNGHEEIVRLLLDQGAEVNAQGGEYGNALQAASYDGYEGMVRLLLEKGADINAEGGSYGNALQAASYEGHEVMVRLLLDQGAEVNAQGGFCGNALQAASSNGHKAIVQLLLDRGANDQPAISSN